MTKLLLIDLRNFVQLEKVTETALAKYCTYICLRFTYMKVTYALYKYYE